MRLSIWESLEEDTAGTAEAEVVEVAEAVPAPVVLDALFWLLPSVRW